MKMLACVVFEVNENEKVEDVVARIEKVVGGNGTCCDVSTMVNSEPSWRNELKNILSSLGEGISTKGYGVLFDIMEYVEQNNECEKYFQLKELYAYVTEKTGMPYAKIERNIRALIERIYNNNTTQQVQRILGNGAIGRPKMVNSKFIALLIEKLF